MAESEGLASEGTSSKHYRSVARFVPYDETRPWYQEPFNFVATDVLHAPGDKAREVATFMRVERGKTIFDHQSFLLARGDDGKFERNKGPPLVFRSRGRGHANDGAPMARTGWLDLGLGCWPTCPRLSDFFYYWYDSRGFIIEHYADADLVNEDTETTYSPAGVMAVWEPPVPGGKASANRGSPPQWRWTPRGMRVASRVTDLDPQQATITPVNGKLIAGDAIIDADGIPSTTRATIEEGELVFWFDADRRIVVYPTRNNDIWNFVCIHPDRRWEDDDKSWNRSGSQQHLLREYEGFDERALALLLIADPSTLKVWRLMDMDTVEDWCMGMLCLLGDAAHPFLPHHGQGAAQAMEDAASLGVIFPAGTDAHETGADIRGLESAGKKVDHMTELILINCGYDEHHNSIHRLRIWEYSNNPPKLWRMPVSFGSASGPRQSLLGSARRWSNKGSSFSPDSVAYALYVHTSLQNLDWLGGKGHDYFAFLLHGIVYREKDGSTVTGSFVAVMWRNLTDPIMTGREELGCPKLFCDLGVQ
ncbi:FAD binding domain protein [Beauveria brongniartii RCEF 3172]|uniref:FAD binding domain protein n=1 Tax=Beauveria brongniartii RCEF 3172 TaxID=1081107 RepID=A0A167BD97_9HYPO|nr:FAD binding domain protein [Beauveria brongniartii RCEF 3172]